MITTVEEFATTVRTESDAWPIEQPRWFRGEPASCPTPLLPGLYRFVWMLNPLHLNHHARGAPAGENPNDLPESRGLQHARDGESNATRPSPALIPSSADIVGTQREVR